ncbi:P-loop containing nucleoside triphosphate hydrolase protein [Aspergillus sclerotiicarbonarius CBS 121057]|uniref:P-loop containing nucleoside triphosphate hydrolase protein n=1 Tax=Aspergillus sclerotiicarbonarius (strain CBS 121057 / IBT 28362) TaxID=1448318 RepID=A0A319FLT0_ASPSB|nr:P-loop containing nucleoside triphosphate hydrolase protein [Aspergillus sclerotiicarbonarius CBS 121057]
MDIEEVGQSAPLVQDQQLMDHIAALEEENSLLKSWIDPECIHEGQHFSQVVYRLKRDNMVFFRPPSWSREDSSEGTRYILRGNSLSMSAEEYLKDRRNLAFVVFESYESMTVDRPKVAQNQKADAPPLPKPSAESVLFVSSEMKRAIRNFVSKHTDFKQLFPSFNVAEGIPSPYLFWYCTRSSYESVLQSLPPCEGALIKLFAKWVDGKHKTEYACANDGFKRGVITSKSMKYLVKPGDPLIVQEKSVLQAYQATSWIRGKAKDTVNDTIEDVNGFDRLFEVSAWSYEFDGGFYQNHVNLAIELDVADPEEEIALRSLRVVPLDYASADVKRKLEDRGKTYWACRKRRLISYDGGDGVGFLDNNITRFMIDFRTYWQLHPSDKSTSTTNRTEITSERMEFDEPPSEPEIFLFPSHIVGFDLRRKKWVDLDMDHIKDVEWNKKAFEGLVINEETKELVHALVTNRIVSEGGSDMIDDKGNGLTILLHGGPGTGKTFTAESIAELAEKPLYRLTCGDIGTKAEEVEQHLESALYLSKIWDCVVLLDDADVFLQERDVKNLQRNALVAVFLQVLEYYNGILILTSNRVGVFDEAFRSRFQVSLHYPNLSRSQRHKIWWNLINRLKRLQQPGIDFEDIECYIGELAEQEMNGRQIRNAITTARQLAKFKGRNMSHVELKHVIYVGGRFDKYRFYLDTGMTDDQIARESGIR